MIEDIYDLIEKDDRDGLEKMYDDIEKEEFNKLLPLNFFTKDKAKKHFPKSEWVFEFFDDKGYEMDMNTFYITLDKGINEIIEYLFFEKSIYNHFAPEIVAELGYLHCLECLANLNFYKKDINNHWSRCKINQKNFILNNDTLNAAKFGGDPDCIEFMLENNS